MKKGWISIVIAAAVALLVLSTTACQKTADNAKETAAEVTEYAGDATEQAVEAVDQAIDDGA
ncbi:MAG: hypothetical protein MUP13_07025, partial [Thermoanaerobaculales bacterium]|nr:hypothetical protein [Thermoanaerobaculales bacterium]